MHGSRHTRLLFDSNIKQIYKASNLIIDGNTKTCCFNVPDMWSVSKENRSECTLKRFQCMQFQKGGRWEKVCIYFWKSGHFYKRWSHREIQLYF